MTHRDITVGVFQDLIQTKMVIVIVKILTNAILITAGALINVSTTKVVTCVNVLTGETFGLVKMAKPVSQFVHGISSILATSAGISRAKRTTGTPRPAVKRSTPREQASAVLSTLKSGTAVNPIEGT